jgi:hypothetical protein
VLLTIIFGQICLLAPATENFCGVERVLNELFYGIYYGYYYGYGWLLLLLLYLLWLLVWLLKPCWPQFGILDLIYGNSKSIRNLLFASTISVDNYMAIPACSNTSV